MTRPTSTSSRSFRAFPGGVPRGGARPGITLLEVIISLLLLGIVFSASIPAIVWVVRHQRALERRQVARLEAANLLDELTHRPWKELSPGDSLEIPLPADLEQDFPALRVQTRVVEETDPPARRVTVQIAWEDAPGRPNLPVTLTGWVFPPPGETR